MTLFLSRVFWVPLLHPGPVLGAENLDKKSVFLKTKVAEFLNFSEQKIAL